MKNKAEYRILFDTSGCLMQNTIVLFIDGKLTEAELRKVENHALSCELCADALEGAGHFKSAHTYQKRIEQMHQSAWRRSLDGNNKSRRLYFGLSSVAASLILLMGIFFILHFDKLFKEEFSGAAKKEIALSEVEDTIAQEQNMLNFQEPKGEIISQPTKAKSGSSIKKEKVKSDISQETFFVESEDEVELEFNDNFEIAEEESISTDYALPQKTEMSKPAMVAESGNRGAADKEEAAMGMSNEIQSERGVDLSSQKKSAFRRSREDQSSSDESYIIAEVKPMFRGGGIENFNSYLADSLRVIIPDSVWVKSIVISFVVDRSGNVNNVKLVTGTSSNELNNSIINFVKSSPVWIPGSIAGEPIETEEQTEVVIDSSKHNKVQ
jgi:hypothetical protein